MAAYFLLLLTPFCSVAQSEKGIKHRKFTLGAGYEHTRMLDLNTSPLLYASNNGTFHLAYHPLARKLYWKVSASLSVGNNQSARHGVRTAIYPNKPNLFGEADTTHYALNPALSYLSFTIRASAYKVLVTDRLFVGGALNNSHYYSALGADSWFFNHTSLQPTVITKWSPSSRSTLSLQLTGSLFSYIVAQPYTLDPSLPVNSYFKAYLITGSAFASPISFQQFGFTASCSHSLSRGNDIGLQYHFNWINHKPDNYRNRGMYSNSMSLFYQF